MLPRNGRPDPERLAIVLPGGGARGAYEVGALSVLLPELEARGEDVDLICGTSVGAINAAHLASMAHLPAAEQAERAVERWEGIRRTDVFARIVGPRTPVSLARLVGDVLGVPGLRFGSALDPSPLRKNLDHWIDWPQLHHNVDSGVLEAVCTVATSIARGGPVGFLETGGRAGPQSTSEDVHYVPVRLAPEHVRASAAIPIVFPAVEVKNPPAARGFYVDGGTRLNSPIKPAIDLGATRALVIGFEPLAARRRSVAGRPPRLSDVAANVLDGLLLDGVTADMHRLAAVNSFFAESASGGPAPSARAYRAARGRRPYRRISYALVAPEREGEIGRMAERIFAERYGGLGALRDLDYVVLGRLLAGRALGRGELLSFLFFDKRYISELLELGRRDAQRWLDRHPAFWCADSAHAFDRDPARARAERELASLGEWRELRRR